MEDGITIVIVDDHAVVRSGLMAYLSTSSGFNVVGEAATGEEAIGLVSQHSPDVVLMDLILPGMNGAKATSEIKRINAQTKIVLLTSTHDEELIFSAFKSGADACILKDMKMENLTDALLGAVNNQVKFHPRIAVQILNNLRLYESFDGNPQLTITQREKEILELISKGYSNRKISRKLGISEHKINILLGSVLAKIHLLGHTNSVFS